MAALGAELMIIEWHRAPPAVQAHLIAWSPKHSPTSWSPHYKSDRHGAARTNAPSLLRQIVVPPGIPFALVTVLSPTADSSGSASWNRRIKEATAE